MTIQKRACVFLALCAAAVAATPLKSMAGDLYAGSNEERSFAASLASETPNQLWLNANALRGEIAIACGVSGVLIGASAILETAPVVGFIPKVMTNRKLSDDVWGENIDLDHERFEYNDRDNLRGFGTTLGGALSTVFGTLRAAVVVLKSSSANGTYKLTQGAYWGTKNLGGDLFSRHGACRVAIDKYRDVRAAQVESAASAKQAHGGESAAPAERRSSATASVN